MYLIDRSTAIHEAGHAVAHVRFGILAGDVTIAAKKTDTHLVMGSAQAEGAESVWSADEAKPQVLAFCSGYASLIAAGYSDEAARKGCSDDFEQAAYLIDYWGLGAFDDWLPQAVALMRQEENIKAVSLVAEHLTRYESLDGDYINILVTVADGECTSTEWERYLAFRDWRPPK